MSKVNGSGDTSRNRDIEARVPGLPRRQRASRRAIDVLASAPALGQDGLTTRALDGQDGAPAMRGPKAA